MANPPQQQEIHALTSRVDSLERQQAETTVAVRHLGDEVHGFITTVAGVAQKHGKLEEKIDGLREQQKAQHEQTSKQLTELATGLKPLTDAFTTPDAAKDALKGLAEREKFWSGIWKVMIHETASWAARGVIFLLVAGLLSILAQKLGISLPEKP